MKRLLALAGFIILVLCLTPSPAWAHAGFVSSTPEPGSELSTAPGVVTIRFSEPLNAGLSRAQVRSPDGTRFDGRVQSNGDILVPLSTNAQGVYVVSWTTISAVDGHTLTGSFEFGVGVAPFAGEAATGSTPRVADLFIAVARVVEDAALLAAVGLLVLRRLGRDLGWLRTPITPMLILAFLGGLTVVLGEAFAASPSPSLSAVGAYLFTGLPGFARTTRVGLEAIAALVALRRPGLAVLPIGATLVALAAAGHAAAVDPRWLGVSVEALHLASVAIWTGGILALAFQRPPGGWLAEPGSILLERFTPPALAAFALTASTGIVRAVQELGSFSAVFTSSYGIVLAAKVLLVVAMAQLSFFAWRRTLVRPRLEGAIALSVVGAAALLAAFPLPPSRGEEAEAQQVGTAATASALPQPGDLTLGSHAGEVLVGLSVRPGAGGSDELSIYLQDLGSERTTGERAVTMRLDGRPIQVQDCGDTCRQVRADVHNGDRLDVRVGGDNGGVARFTLPRIDSPPGTSALVHMMRQMHSLTSYRLDETLNSGLATVRSQYAFLAPHSYQATVVEPSGGISKTVVIGGTRYLQRTPQSGWTKESGGPPIPVPSFIWDSFQPFSDARMIGHAGIDGVQTTEVAFFGGEQQHFPVWFRLWIDDRGLVRRAHMRAQGHFMDHRYFDFNAPIAINPPKG